MSTTSAKLVLVAGATGHVGKQVVSSLLRQGANVRVFVRPGSSTAAFDGLKNVAVVRGDVMDPATLDEALKDCDAVINTFAGYMGRRKTDTSSIDVEGNANVARAAAKQSPKKPRVVLLSIVAAEKATEVPHFFDKKRAEDLIRESGAPFVFVRAGMFFDMTGDDVIKDNVLKGRYIGLGDKTTKWTYTFTPDLADALAKAALTENTKILGQTIDVGSNQPMSNGEVHELLQKHTGLKLSAWTLPWWLVSGVGRFAGLFKTLAKDMTLMLEFFGSGQYVASHGDLAGELLEMPNPSPDELVKRWAIHTGLVKKSG
jgi:uncharacterized protein YbjT (DUF2867 family)